MASPLERWRERCAVAAVKGKGLRWWQRRRKYSAGLLCALFAAPATGDIAPAYALVALASLMYRIGPEVDGLRLALTWLREEIERG